LLHSWSLRYFHVIVTPYRQRDEARRWAKKLKAKLDEPHSRKAADLDARLDPLGRAQYPVLVISASGDTGARDVVVVLEPATVLLSGEPTSFGAIEPQHDVHMRLAITHDDFPKGPRILEHLRWEDFRGAQAKDVSQTV
jgi:hypothetical protein